MKSGRRCRLLFSNNRLKRAQIAPQSDFRGDGRSLFPLRLRSGAIFLMFCAIADSEALLAYFGDPSHPRI